MPEQFDRGGRHLKTTAPTTVYQAPSSSASDRAVIMDCTAAHVDPAGAPVGLEIRATSADGSSSRLLSAREIIHPSSSMRMLTNKGVLRSGERLQAVASRGGALDVGVSVLARAQQLNRLVVPTIEARAAFLPPVDVGETGIVRVPAIGAVAAFPAPLLRLGAAIQVPSTAAVATLPTVSISGLVGQKMRPPAIAVAATFPAPGLGSATITPPIQLATGTVAPLLGAGGATSSTGWTLIASGSVDDTFVQFADFGFPVWIDGTSYQGCYIGSNGYVTFGAGSSLFSGAGASVPPLPKIHFAAGDRSYQRVYTRTGQVQMTVGFASLRWEGSASTSGTIGSPTVVVEMTFFEIPRQGDPQWVEVRYGVNNTTGVFMVANASTAFASATSSANSSWVLAGTAAGTAWTMTSNRYVARG